MYAEHRYQPRQSRTVSLGAAFAINGAIIVGLIYAAPGIVKVVNPGVIEAYNVREVPPPPPDPVEKPTIEAKTPSQRPIVAPDPLVKTDTEAAFETTDEILPDQPPITKPVDTGPPVVADPPRPVAVFSAARRDSRYADDFQPQYPASELRAQRDGKVSVRVLVGADGRVKAVEQLSATSAAFFEATKRQALSRWRFKPATRGGVAEESWMTLSVTFRIQDQ